MKQRNATDIPFYEAKSLEDMSFEEWESICDGCGICCLEKLEDEATGVITLTSVACQYLDTVNCRCLIYPHRSQLAPDCLELSPANLKTLSWLPDTCAYRCLSEGRKLEWWHPLLSGDTETVHHAGISVRDRVIPGKYVHPQDLYGSME